MQKQGCITRGEEKKSSVTEPLAVLCVLHLVCHIKKWMGLGDLIGDLKYIYKLNLYIYIQTTYIYIYLFLILGMDSSAYRSKTQRFWSLFGQGVPFDATSPRSFTSTSHVLAHSRQFFIFACLIFCVNFLANFLRQITQKNAFCQFLPGICAIFCVSLIDAAHAAFAVFLFGSNECAGLPPPFRQFVTLGLRKGMQ